MAGSNPEMDSIVDELAAQVAAGWLTAEEAAMRHPELAERLLPMLHLTERLSTAGHPSLDRSARVRILSQVLANVPETGRDQILRSTRHVAAFQMVWLRSLAAMLVAVVFSTSSLVAAQSALPGEPLYPFKHVSEEAQMALTLPEERSTLHIAMAERRLDEVERLASHGSIHPDALQALSTETQAAVQSAEGLPPSRRTAVLAQVMTLTQRQEETLKAVMAQAPEIRQPEIASALRTVNQSREKAAQGLGLHPAPAQPTAGPGTTPAGVPIQADTPSDPGKDKPPAPVTTAGSNDPSGPPQAPDKQAPAMSPAVTGGSNPPALGKSTTPGSTIKPGSGQQPDKNDPVHRSKRGPKP